MRQSGPPQRKTPLRATAKPLTPEQVARRQATADRARERARANALSGGAVPRVKRPDRPARGSADRQPARPPTPRRTGPTVEVRELVRARDQGRCVRCGAPAADQDHRSGRGMGGRKGVRSVRINQPSWLLTLCGQGNTSGCHRWKETERVDAEALGFRIPRNAADIDAASVPVRTHTGWALFHDDGTRTPCPPPEGAAT